MVLVVRGSDPEALTRLENEEGAAERVGGPLSISREKDA